MSGDVPLNPVAGPSTQLMAPPENSEESQEVTQSEGFHLKPSQLLPGLVEVVREKQGADSSFICFNQLKDSFLSTLREGL